MGKFIVLEGPDGVGKSTLTTRLANRLGGSSMCFPERRTFYGKLINAWLKGEWHASYKPEAQILSDHPRVDSDLDAAVFQALQTVNRLEVARHLEHLTKGSPDPLVCDRYWPSGYAYGSADGLDPEMLMKLHATLPQPDLFVLIECPMDVVEARMRARNDAKADHYELRGRAYFEKVRAAYDELWRMKEAVEPSRWVRFPSDGSTSLPETVERLAQAVGG